MLQNGHDLAAHAALRNTFQSCIDSIDQGVKPVVDPNATSDEAWEITARNLGSNFGGGDHAEWRREQRALTGRPTTQVASHSGQTMSTIGIASARQATHRATNNHLRNPEAANAAATAAEARSAAGGAANGVPAAAAPVAAAASSSEVVHYLLDSDEDCGNQDNVEVEYVPAGSGASKKQAANSSPGEKKKPAKKKATERLYPDGQAQKMAYQPTFGVPLGTSTNTAASSKDPRDIGPFGTTGSRDAGGNRSGGTGRPTVSGGTGGGTAAPGSGAVGMKTPANPPGSTGQGFGSHHHLSATAMGAALYPNALTGSTSGRGGGGGAGGVGYPPEVITMLESVVELSLRNSDGGRALMGRSPSGGGDGRDYNAMTHALLGFGERALQYIAPALKLNPNASPDAIIACLFVMGFEKLK